MDKTDTLFDLRVVERNIANGVVTRAAYEAWLEKQEDVSDRVVESNTRFVHTSGDQDD